MIKGYVVRKKKIKGRTKIQISHLLKYLVNKKALLRNPNGVGKILANLVSDRSMGLYVLGTGILVADQYFLAWVANLSH